MSSHALASVWTMILMMSFAASAQDQPAAPPAGGKAPTLDELLNIPAPQPPAQPAQPGQAPKAPPMLEPQVIELPSESSPDAFRLAVLDMQDAAGRLTERQDPGLDTQRVQERVIRRLDQLINQLKQQQQSQSQQQQQRQQDQGAQQNQQGQQQQQRNQQANTSADRAGQRGEVRDGQRGDSALAEKLAEWGNLPPVLRDQLLQGTADRFSQLYRTLTERYYQRLAEESP